MSESEHKQTVLLVHNYYQIPGGEDTVVDNEKRLLEDYGHKVVLYTRNNNELKRMRKLQKLALPFITVFNPKTYKDIKKIIREEKIDIVHVHNTLNLVSLAVYYAAEKMNVPVVQTIHNFRFLCPGATFYRDGHICEDCVDKGLKCAIKHNCYRGSKAQTLICVVNTWIHRHTGILKNIYFICLTEFNKEKLEYLRQVDPERIFVKPNFTFLAMNAANNDERTYYLYVGRIEEIKGTRILIDAFTKMPKRELYLAGDGSLLLSMSTHVKEKHIENIHFLGRLSHDEVIEKMREAKAVILPSQVYEGFPMTIPEAFSVRTPMIVGDLGNNGVLIKSKYNGMKFKYDDADALIKAVNEYETLDFISLQKKAFHCYEQEYSPEANYENLMSIYKKAERN